MIALVRRLHAISYSRYLAVSVAALSVDLGLFMMLRTAGLPVAIVAALSYAAGIVAHWALSSRMVFATRLEAPGTPRARQQLLFLLSALIGLAITVAIVSVVSLFTDPRLAKLAAVAVSFQTTWLLRSRVVFA